MMDGRIATSPEAAALASECVEDLGREWVRTAQDLLEQVGIGRGMTHVVAQYKSWRAVAIPVERAIVKRAAAVEEARAAYDLFERVGKVIKRQVEERGLSAVEMGLRRLHLHLFEDSKEVIAEAEHFFAMLAAIEECRPAGVVGDAPKDASRIGDKALSGDRAGGDGPAESDPRGGEAPCNGMTPGGTPTGSSVLPDVKIRSLVDATGAAGDRALKRAATDVPVRGLKGSLRRVGRRTWEVQFADEPPHLIEGADCRYLAVVLSLQREGGIEVEELEALVNGRCREGTRGRLEAIDPETKERLEALKEEIDQARREGDSVKLDRALQEVGAFEGYVNRATGLHGLPRSTSDTQKLADAMRQRIRRSIRAIPQESQCRHHLDRAIKAGSVVRYEPDVEIQWDVSPEFNGQTLS